MYVLHVWTCSVDNSWPEMRSAAPPYSHTAPGHKHQGEKSQQTARISPSVCVSCTTYTLPSVICTASQCIYGTEILCCVDTPVTAVFLLSIMHLHSLESICDTVIIYRLYSNIYKLTCRWICDLVQ